MSSKLKLKSTAGGSRSLVIDDTITDDAEIDVSVGGIESGSNANGSYTKFPDGTLIQYGVRSQPSWINSASGNVKKTPPAFGIFPIAFINTDIAVSASTLSNSDTWATAQDITTTTFTLISFSGTTVNIGIDVSWQAIGRWK